MFKKLKINNKCLEFFRKQCLENVKTKIIREKLKTNLCPKTIWKHYNNGEKNGKKIIVHDTNRKKK